jgi:hypothetical protein
MLNNQRLRITAAPLHNVLGVNILEKVMKILKFLVFFTVIISSSSNADELYPYYSLGEWILGKQHKTIMGEKGPFKNINIIGKKKQYTATTKTVFSDDTPVKLFFKRRKLHRLELKLYEGNSYEKALASAESIISIFEKEYGGAYMAGYTTSEGLKPEEFGQIFGLLLEKSKISLAEINSEDSEGKESYFNMFVDLSTEHDSKNNFLYGKFSYFGDRDIYNVTVFEDKKFNDEHVEPNMIYIGAKKNINKAL